MNITIASCNYFFRIKNRILFKTGLILLMMSLVFVFSPPASKAARLKDVARVAGVRENQLIGYGLVIGLNGTGDGKGTEFTIQTLSSMLVKMGIRVNPGQVKVKNVAAVIVTGELPPFARPGIRLDVLVSSIGDCKSLQGGTLMLTPLRGIDGNIYALVQGPVSIGGFAAASGGAGAQKNHPTVGTIPSGALVEREMAIPMQFREQLDFVLFQPDFTTAEMIAETMNNKIGAPIASSIDSRTVTVKVPPRFQDRVVDYIALLEGIEVFIDTPARIVINERTGTIVMGENVRLSTVAISHGGLSVVITGEQKVSQPNPFGEGETVVVEDTNIEVEEKPARLIMVSEGVSLGDVVKALNAVGVTPRDLISVLQVIKNAGALNAEMVIM